MGKSPRGILGTSIFHGIILVIVIFFGFIVPDPPPEEEGILINFGTDITGSGDTEPMYSQASETSPAPSQESVAAVEESTEEIISQDFEEAPAVEAEKEVVKETKPKEIIKKPVVEQQQEKVRETVPEQIVEETEVTPQEEEPRKVNENALYKGRANTDESSGSEGISRGDGNQGSVTGSPDSKNYSEGLSSGNGGINFSLEGRNPISLPKPEYNVQEEGKVVVKIRVNREGIVTWAEAGAPGTNTLNKVLLDAARKAALKARFDKSTASIQQGTITYHFLLQ